MWRHEAFRPGKAWHVEEAHLFPTSGGEPLWRVTRQPRDIRICTLVWPQNVAAGGSPELPGAMQFYDPAANESKAMGKCIAPRRSREPPVFIGLRRDLR